MSKNIRRAFNFNAGPSALPLAALQQAQDELLDFQGCGMSILEMSHRSKEYDAVHNKTIALLRVNCWRCRRTMTSCFYRVGLVCSLP